MNQVQFIHPAEATLHPDKINCVEMTPLSNTEQNRPHPRSFNMKVRNSHPADAAVSAGCRHSECDGTQAFIEDILISKCLLGFCWHIILLLL